MSGLLAALAAAAAVALAVGRPAGAPRPSRRSHRPDGPLGQTSPTLALPAALGLLGAVALAGLDGTRLATAAVLTAAGVTLARGWSRRRRLAAADRRRQVVVDFCEALAGELRAGQPVQHAVERAAQVWPEAEPVAAAAALGADLPAALRRLADLPGARALARLAGAWQISASTGAGLALAVEQVVATARAEQATARLVQGELAAARATARLVLSLPAVVLLAAQGLGARPWRFLLDTPAGVACLAAGLAFALVGLAWIDRIAASSTGPP